MVLLNAEEEIKNNHPIDVKKEVLEAEERIRPYIRETPLEYSACLSKVGESKVYLKLENLQHTGSFKTRWALSKVLYLPSQK